MLHVLLAILCLPILAMATGLCFFLLFGFSAYTPREEQDQPDQPQADRGADLDTADLHLGSAA